MENERTFFVPRKIRVVGCLNCPYFVAGKTVCLGGDPEVPETLPPVCNHPSFKERASLREEFLSGPSYIPYWCPLEFETCNTCAE